RALTTTLSHPHLLVFEILISSSTLFRGRHRFFVCFKYRSRKQPHMLSSQILHFVEPGPSKTGRRPGLWGSLPSGLRVSAYELLVAQTRKSTMMI
ncbi:Unknown protein, partial [Striga hermonthica]